MAAKWDWKITALPGIGECAILMQIDKATNWAKIERVTIFATGPQGQFGMQKLLGIEKGLMEPQGMMYIGGMALFEPKDDMLTNLNALWSGIVLPPSRNNA